jgi:kanamycin kinase/aminoglycoside 3'-phosphotransferase-2
VKPLKEIPAVLAKLTDRFTWKHIEIGHSDAATYLLQGTSVNQYLKIQTLSSYEGLYRERERLEWLQGKLPVPEVIYYGKDDSNEYLLISEVKGIHTASKVYETNLPQLMHLLGTGLKTVHSVAVEQCPFDQTLDIKLSAARERVENGYVDENEFDKIRQGLSATAILEELIATRPHFEDLVFTHGDYCLPNIMVHEDRISGFIDWGRGGISDRYQDLALALRSIVYNFGNQYIPLFLNAYGITEADAAKVDYYQLLDELF